MALRDTVIRLAHARPDLRPHLLPLLTAAAVRPKFPAFAPLLKWMRQTWPAGEFEPKLWDIGASYPAWNVMSKGQALIVIRSRGAAGWDANFPQGYEHRIWKAETPPTIKDLKEFVNAGIQRSTSLTDKLTSPVSGVESTKTWFDTVDEWHSTHVDLVLSLFTSDPVPESRIRSWLETNWAAVCTLIKYDPPDDRRMAGWDDDDDDDDGYGDEGYDRPEPGLGWLDPRRLSLREFEEIRVRQEGAKVRVSMSAAHR